MKTDLYSKETTEMNALSIQCNFDLHFLQKKGSEEH